MARPETAGPEPTRPSSGSTGRSGVLAGTVRRFIVAESGSTAIEYALLIGMMGVALIGMLLYSGGLKPIYDSFASGFPAPA